MRNLSLKRSGTVRVNSLKHSCSQVRLDVRPLRRLTNLLVNNLEYLPTLTEIKPRNIFPAELTHVRAV